MTWQLHLGDCLAVLATLEDESVDALVTDPPYSSGGMTRADRMRDASLKYVQSDSRARWRLASFGGDSRDQRAYGYWCALWLSECLRILKHGAPACLFTDWRQLPTTVDSLQAGGFVWRGIVPWAKPSCRPQAGRFSAQCEYIVWGSKGPMPVDYEGAECLPGFYQASPPRDRIHITQKPVEILRSIVRIAPDGGTVLDPFAGSGTTGVACLEAGRHFVGVEVDPVWHEQARARLESAESQTSLPV